MKGQKAKSATGRQSRAPDAADAADKQIDLEKTHGNRAKPISLHPLDFQTAIRGLLRKKWPPEKTKKP